MAVRKKNTPKSASRSDRAGAQGSRGKKVSEGSLREKTGGGAISGNLSKAGGTTAGRAEGNEPDIEHALQQKQKRRGQ